MIPYLLLTVEYISVHTGLYAQNNVFCTDIPHNMIDSTKLIDISKNSGFDIWVPLKAQQWLSFICLHSASTVPSKTKRDLNLETFKRAEALLFCNKVIFP